MTTDNIWIAIIITLPATIAAIAGWHQSRKTNNGKMGEVNEKLDNISDNQLDNLTECVDKLSHEVKTLIARFNDHLISHHRRR